MTRPFYRLDADRTIARSWSLGDVRSPDGAIPRLRAGIRFEGSTPLSVAITHPGLALDFTVTSFAVPIMSAQLARAISAVAGSDIQCLPVEIAGQSGMMVMNAVRVIPCLDERQSEFLKWTKEDHRADLAGQYRQVSKLVIDPNAIPAGAHVFRIEGWLVALIVSDSVKAAMERVGCRGAEFSEVTPPRQPPTRGG